MYASVNFEIVGNCNAKCPWCVTGKMARGGFRQPKQFIEVEQFARALDRLLAIGAVGPRSVIHLYNWGEPTLHPRLNDLLRELKKRDLWYAISTNGSIPFTFAPEVVAKLGILMVSMPGFSQTSYDKVHGFKFEKILHNIDNMLESVSAMGFPRRGTVIGMHVYQFNIQEIKAALLHFANRSAVLAPYYAGINDFEMAMDYLGNRLSVPLWRKLSQELMLYYVDDLIARMPKEYSCPQFKSLTLDEQCRVNTCCGLPRDHPELALGSIFDLSLAEITEKKVTRSVCRSCMASGWPWWMDNLPYLDLLLNPFVLPEVVSGKRAVVSPAVVSVDEGAIQLSICIPTRNRRTLLAHTLDGLAWTQSCGRKIEILVVDNGSGDGSEGVARQRGEQFGHFRYLRQPQEFSPEQNRMAALRLARGQFAVYLADDDHLLWEDLLNEIDHLICHPEIVASYAPWWMWDDTAGVERALFYHLDREYLFSRTDSVQLFNFLMSFHIVPRMGIYRTDLLGSILYPSHHVSSTYLLPFRALEYGQVRFQPHPFYVQMVRAGFSGHQLRGKEHKSRVELSPDRDGLELALSLALGQAGVPHLPDAGREQAVQIIHRGGMVDRLEQAARVASQDGDFIGAHELLRRQLLWSSQEEQRQAVRRQDPVITSEAAFQALGELFGLLPGVLSLVFCDLESAEGIREKFHRIFPNIATTIRDRATATTAPDRHSCLYLVDQQESRQALRVAGVAPGQIVLTGDLLKLFRLNI